MRENLLISGLFRMYVVTALIQQCHGIASVSFSPSLTNMVIATNYEGALIDATIIPNTNALSYQLTGTQGGQSSTVNFMSASCQGANDSTTTYLKATCTTTHSIQFSTNQALASDTTLSLAVSATGYSLSFSLTFNTIDCTAEARSMSTVMATTSTPCGFNCGVTYQCNSGFSTATGAATYVATCSKYAVLEPATEQCFTVITTTTTATTVFSGAGHSADYTKLTVILELLIGVFVLYIL